MNFGKLCADNRSTDIQYGMVSRKNLSTYCDSRLFEKLEVICLNNASEDHSKEIIEKFVEKYPNIFRLVDRNSRGYGSSINQAIREAQGRYFRIIDADDWVDTEELVHLVEMLESCTCDVILTDYTIVNMQDGSCTAIRAGAQGVPYGEILYSPSMPKKTLPSIHATTYRTGLLQESGFFMQDGIFFVDEEYVILPYLHAETVMYEPYNVYRYQVANPEQSTSPKNRGKYYSHREQVLKRLLRDYQIACVNSYPKDRLDYCRERIQRGVGDHFTTLFIYIRNTKNGRKLAQDWKHYLQQNAPDFWHGIRCKAQILLFLNLFSVSPEQYGKWKTRFLSRK